MLVHKFTGSAMSESPNPSPGFSENQAILIIRDVEVLSDTETTGILGHTTRIHRFIAKFHNNRAAIPFQ